MLLNKKKKINFVQNQKIYNSLLNFPTLFLKDYLQTISFKNIVDEIEFVHNEETKKSFRLNFFKTLKFFFLLKEFKKKNICYTNLKNNLIFSNNLLKRKKLHRFFILKRVKGGFRTSSLGLTSFMPKSLLKLSKNKQLLIGFKIYKRKRKFLYKKKLKVNLVSSTKKKIPFKGKSLSKKKNLFEKKSLQKKK